MITLFVAILAAVFLLLGWPATAFWVMALALLHGVVALIRIFRDRDAVDEVYRTVKLDEAFHRAGLDPTILHLGRGMLLPTVVKGGVIAIVIVATWRFGQVAGYF